MGQVNTVNARAQFSEIINRAAFGKERVTLTRRGKEIVAVVPARVGAECAERWNDTVGRSLGLSAVATAHQN